MHKNISITFYLHQRILFWNPARCVGGYKGERLAPSVIWDQANCMVFKPGTSWWEASACTTSPCPMWHHIEYRISAILLETWKTDFVLRTPECGDVSRPHTCNCCRPAAVKAGSLMLWLQLKPLVPQSSPVSSSNSLLCILWQRPRPRKRVCKEAEAFSL